MRARPFAAAAVLLALAGPALAQPPENRPRDKRNPELNPARLLAPFQPVVAKANTATVRVLAGGKQVALGTVVSADGHILTKSSDLRGEVTVEFHDGSTAGAKLVGAHVPTDLALLKIEKKAGLTPLAFGDSKVAALGNWLAAAGVGSDATAVGIVSVVTRKLNGFEKGTARSENRGFLGVILSQKTVAEGGAMVETVSPGGAAAKAGVKAKDVIYEVNGKAVDGFDALQDTLAASTPGQKIELSLRRKGEELKLPVTLAGPPADFKDRSDIQNSMGGPLSGRRGGFETVLQTDMVVDPKNCGGAVVDLDGRVIGVCIARAGRVETFVLPGEIVRAVVDDLRSGKFPATLPAGASAAPPAGGTGVKPTTPPAPRPTPGGDPAQGTRNP